MVKHRAIPPQTKKFIFFSGMREWLIAFVFSAFFAVCILFGQALDKEGSVPFTNGLLWVMIVLLTLIVMIMTRFFWSLLATCTQKRVEKRQVISFPQAASGKQFLLTVIFLFLCYLLVLLAVYPGFFVYDAQEEYLQVVTRSFTTHHPLLHVLLLGGVIQAVYKLTGSCNLGIFCYLLLQAGVLSCIFSYLICFLRKKGFSRILQVIITLYFGLFPVIVMFTLCSAKDGLFTGLLLLLFLFTWELCRKPESFFGRKNRKKQICFILAAAGMMLFRHNGMYAFLVFAIGLVLFFRKEKSYRLSMAVCAGIALAVYLLGSKGLAFACHAQDSEHQEMMTVPIQQMARTYAYDKDSLDEEQLETLYEILPEEALNRYTPKVSDGVKYYFNNDAFTANRAKYLKLWLELGAEHPLTYLNAWFMTSFGFWYPNTVIDVYRGNTVFTFTYEDSSYFGYEVEEPGTRHSLIPWLNEWYRQLSLEPQIQEIPVLSWFFSMGALFWVMMFTMGYLWTTRRYRQLLPFLLPAAVWLTVILGPTYLVRYVLFLWFLLPLMVCLLARPENL